MDSLKEFFLDDVIEAGCDEAGRGCLAGPVVGAAVILPKGFKCEGLNDSKKLTEKQRNQLREIIENESVAWSVAMIDNEEIDRINILKASIKAMHKALEQLKIIPQHIIIDGNKFIPYKDIPYKTIVKGDSKYLSIAAASILAKTHRDEFMEKIHLSFPQYHWNVNKGYPTKSHRNAISQYGTTTLHRLTFKLLDTQMKLNF